ncbi:MAG TPA: hypothetical protein VFW04_17905 [Gemmatimonadaceae bacterium]|nr:hypothetical protein [Gemmatimonadaceae bacterium]
MQLRNLALMLCAFAVAACTDVNRPDLNNASVNSFSKITSRAQVAALAVGVLSRDRANNETEITINEIIGRDAYVLTTSEPRFVTQLLGTSVDPSGFLGTALWPYDGIRLANIGIDGIAAVDPSAGVLTGDEINSSQGYLRTMKALLYLRAIESRDTAGIPIAVDVPPTDPPAAIVCKPDALRFIVALLDSAHAELQAGINSPFPFSLPSGFAGFDEPGTFDKFNRALTAKVNVYLAYRDFSTNGSIDQTALSAAALDLDSSFVDTTNAQNLNLGPVYVYTTNTGDATNGLFGDPSSTTTRANPRVLTESDPGDQRVARDVVSTSTIKVAGVSSDITFDLYPSPTSTTPLMLNKELILLKAEVDWGQGSLPQALALANFVRTNDGGLPAKSLSSATDILNQILYEKRFSLLWQSGDRWLDARLFGKLNGSNPPVGLGLENGNPPLENAPLPQGELDARSGDVTPTCSGS